MSGRNFLDLCNEVLDIMFYTPAENFDGLETTEGRLVKTKMNNLLRSICSGEQSIWKFREREKFFYLNENQPQYKMPNGYILYIRPADLSNRVPLIYEDNFRYLPVTAKGTPIKYWIYKDKINVFPTPSKEQDGTRYIIRYLTDDYAKSSDGCDKPVMTEATDEPIIPEPYRAVLVYGTAMNFRAARGDAKSEFYKQQYNEVYQNMLYNQRLTDDYVKGSRVQDNIITNRQAYLQDFYNPYVKGTQRI